MNRSLGAVVTFILIGLTMPVWGQQNGSEVQLQSGAQDVGKQFDAAYNRQDAAAIASLFTENGIRVTLYGIIQGRDAIRQDLEKVFKAGCRDLSAAEKVWRTLGNSVWEAGTYSVKCGEQYLHGHYAITFVREGDGFKIRDETLNLTPPASAQPANR